MTSRSRDPGPAAGASGIDGVMVTPLPRYSDERGTVARMLRSDEPGFCGFGEVYFSSVRPGVVKAWKRHQRVTVNFACVVGEVVVVAHDDRTGSSTRGATTEVVISPERYARVTIPPGIWHGFACRGETEAILANCATEPTDVAEYDRVSVTDSVIAYTW